MISDKKVRINLVNMLNLGPKSLVWLEKIDVRSHRDLCLLGPCVVYRRLIEAGYPKNLNMLYGLLGAAMQVDWQEIAYQYKTGQLDNMLASIKDLLPDRKNNGRTKR